MLILSLQRFKLAQSGNTGFLLSKTTCPRLVSSYLLPHSWTFSNYKKCLFNDCLQLTASEFPIYLFELEERYFSDLEEYWQKN
jgi:hypothetical protein